MVKVRTATSSCFTIQYKVAILKLGVRTRPNLKGIEFLAQRLLEWSGGKTHLNVALLFNFRECRIEPSLDENLGVGFTQNRFADKLLKKTGYLHCK
jgi:hypothetical protein